MHRYWSILYRHGISFRVQAITEARALLHRLEAKGFADELAFITCPIGVSGITGKEPEVIAVSVAAQLLQLR